MVKHLFYEKHYLDRGYTYFDADFNIAQSIQRLRDGKKIFKHDIILVYHEAIEADFMKQGLSYEDAHEKANEKFNYATAQKIWEENGHNGKI